MGGMGYGCSSDYAIQASSKLPEWEKDRLVEAPFPVALATIV